MPAPSAVYQWRVERYIELGFTETDAHTLAVAVEHTWDSLGRVWVRPRNWHTVAKAIRAGRSHAEVMEIFT